MSDTNYKISVEISGNDDKFRATGKSSEKAVADVGKEAKKAESKISDLAKAQKNLQGIIKEKFDNTSIGSFVGDITKGTTALDKFIVPAGIAAGVIVGIGAAAVGVGVTLFKLAKDASDFGSEINDASEKTGLGAEALTALKFAAEQAGSDFGEVTKGVTKFTLLVNDAAKGGEEATAVLKKFGLEPKEALNDLEGTFSKVISKIHDLPPGFEQNAAAADIFGKKLGSNLIPVINATGGKFDDFVSKARKLGVTITDEDMRAADEFGDTLGLLQTQLKVTSAKFALQFAPEITGAMDKISDALAENQNTVREWGTSVQETMRGVSEIAEAEASKTAYAWITGFGDKINEFNPGMWAVDAVKKVGRDSLAKEKAMWDNVTISVDPVSKDNMSLLRNKPRTDPDSYLDDTEKQRKDAEKLAKENAAGIAAMNRALADGSKDSFVIAQDKLKEVYKAHTDLSNAFRESFLDNERKFVEYQKQTIGKEFDTRIEQEENAFQKQAIIQQKKNALTAIEADSKKRIIDADKLITDSQKKTAEDSFKVTEQAFNRKLARYKADDEKQIAQLELDKLLQQNGIINEERYAERLGVIHRDSIKDELRLTKELLDDKNLSVEKRAEIAQRIKILEANLATSEINLSRSVKEAVVKDSEEKAKAKQKEIDKEIEYNKVITRARVVGQRPRVVPGAEVTDATPENQSVFGGVAEGLFGGRAEVFATEAEKVKAVYNDLANSAGAALGSMIDAGGQLLEQWIMTGEVSKEAIAQMTASIIAGLVTQSTIKAIFETAEGFAALANFNYAAAAQHFTAAKIYAVVAASSAAVGLGIGAAGGLSGKKGQSSQGNQGETSQSTNKYFSSDGEGKTNFLRQSPQDRQNIEFRKELSMLSNAINSMDNKIGSMSEGEVLVRGANQRPGFFADRTTSELKKNSTKAGEMGRTLGLK